MNPTALKHPHRVAPLRDPTPRRLRGWILLLLAILLMTAGQLHAQNPSPASAPTQQSFTIAWSRYPGWEPWGVAASSGVLDKWAAREGLSIKMTYVDSYPASIEGYVSGRFDGCAMTNIDVVTGPLLGGRNSAVVVIGDYSAGNDGIVMAGGRDLSMLASLPIHLVQDSVSHYLLYRASQNFGLDFAGLRIVDTNENALVEQLASGAAPAIVTWNPHLAGARNVPGAQVVFDSRRLQGEVLDLMVVRGDAPDGLRRALVGAWYETVTQLVSSDPAVRAAMLRALAAQSGVSPEEMALQLEDTAMFFHAWDAAGYLRSPNLQDVWRKALEFAEARALIPNATEAQSRVRVEFPQGAALGGSNGTTVVIDDRFTRAVALGDLLAPR